MNKTIKGIAALTLAGGALLSQCATTTAATRATAKPSVAVVSLFADDQWSAQFLGGVQDEAKKYGISLTESQASYNQAEMITQLQTAITQHPSVIIVNHAANSAALAPEIKKAVQQGIKVITEDVSVPPEKNITQATQDDQGLARLSLNQLGKAIHYKGNIVVVWVGGFVPMEQRMIVLKQFLKQHPGVKVIAQYGGATNTTVQDTLNQTKAVLRQYGPGKIQAIWASWDQFAIGAVQAVEDLHEHVPVYGIDLSQQDINLMRQPGSPWKATAGTDVYEYGRALLRDAVLAGYGQTLPEYVHFPATLVTQSTLPGKNVSIHAYLAEQNPAELQIGNPSLVAKLTGTK